MEKNSRVRQKQDKKEKGEKVKKGGEAGKAGETRTINRNGDKRRQRRRGENESGKQTEEKRA